MFVSNLNTLKLCYSTPSFLFISFDSHTGLSNTIITLTGSGFGSDTSLISVEIDGVACNVAAVTDTQVTCAVGEHAGGTFPIMLQHKVKGYAMSEVVFKYEFQLSGVVPSEGNALKLIAVFFCNQCSYHPNVHIHTKNVRFQSLYSKCVQNSYSSSSYTV